MLMFAAARAGASGCQIISDSLISALHLGLFFGILDMKFLSCGKGAYSTRGAKSDCDGTLCGNDRENKSVRETLQNFPMVPAYILCGAGPSQSQIEVTDIESRLLCSNGSNARSCFSPLTLDHIRVHIGERPLC